jgi:putative hydrolase of the HAD superfamily
MIQLVSSPMRHGYELLVLDLDDTLYLERDFVLSGLAAVAPMIGCMAGISSEIAKGLLLERFLAYGRNQIFDTTLLKVGVEPTAARIAELVDGYRAHKPTIQLFDGVTELLASLRQHYKLGIVTDGLAAVQRRKVEALGIAGLVDIAVFTWEHGPGKPEVGAYRLCAERLAVDPASMIIVGDRPDHDLVAARRLGVPAIRVRTGRFTGECNPADCRILADVAHVTDAASILL